ncbi:MAG TPA: DUF6364 family protein [Phycisphaerae bacterium]|jgi:metal-responsive CopG/Arc/MetJ family transcriptional regulator|nr:DUF6364 family protein [Phycisphaerae bacterium]HVV02091.1 DUF6364 family protein [Verrucomicrobiae bacterium]
MSLSLEKSLIEQADKYAADHGQSVSELVADALRHWMKKRSA